MGTIANLMYFYAGETVRFTVLAKNRDGTVLTTPGSATMTVRISNKASEDSLYEFTTTPEVTLTTSLTGLFTIVLPAATIPLCLEGQTYRFDIFTTLSGDVLHQAGGTFQYQGSVEA